MEQRAESYLVQRRLLRIQIEQKVYGSIVDGARPRFEPCDPGILCGIQSRGSERDQDSASSQSDSESCDGF